MSETPLSVHAALTLADGLSLAGGLKLLPHDPADPPKPSPIDPVIRDALNWGTYPLPGHPAMNLDLASGPSPDPWLLAALNPQPLPPLPVRIAAALVARAELIADASGPDVAASYVQRMIDDICPPPRVIKPPPRGWPRSEPRPILELTVSPSDLVLFAATLRSAARSIAHEQLAEAVEAGAMKAAEQGVSELPATE